MSPQNYKNCKEMSDALRDGIIETEEKYESYMSALRKTKKS